MFYLPAMYYPINKEDRATGFLIPIYGASTIKGQTLQQRVLLGDQPQPGRDVLPRLLLEDRAGLRRRVPLRRSRRLVGQRPDLRAARARRHLRAAGRHDDDAAAASTATRSTAACCRRCRAHVRAERQRQLLLEPASRSSATSRTSTPRPTARAASASTSPATGAPTRSAAPSSATRSSPTTTRRLDRHRLAAAHQLQPRREAARRARRSTSAPSSEYVDADPHRQDRRRSTATISGLTRIDVCPDAALSVHQAGRS